MSVNLDGFSRSARFSEPLVVISGKRIGPVFADWSFMTASMKVLRLTDPKGEVRGLLSISGSSCVLSPLEPPDETCRLQLFDVTSPVKVTVRERSPGREALLEWGDGSFMLRYGSDAMPENLRDPVGRSTLCLLNAENGLGTFVISSKGCQGLMVRA